MASSELPLVGSQAFFLTISYQSTVKYLSYLTDTKQSKAQVMNFENETVLSQGRISIRSLLPEIGTEELRKEIISGLFAAQKFISSKYFYNDAGSVLFEEITHLEEYYPTRTEKSILRRIAPDLMKKYTSYDVVELGSGDCSKIAILLSAALAADSGNIHYMPLDFSESAIRNSATGLKEIHSKVNIEGYVVDFTSQFGLIQLDRPSLICFFGSTIGNFDRSSSLELMKNIGDNMKQGDVLLMGMDMVKPEPVLHAAYNDKRGVTAAFNKNILSTVNDILDSDFNPDNFEHLAAFNKRKARMEMHLVAVKDTTVHSPYFRTDLTLKKGERIHTENSHKYTSKDIQEFARVANLNISNIHTDDNNWFTLVELQK